MTSQELAIRVRKQRARVAYLRLHGEEVRAVAAASSASVRAILESLEATRPA